MNWEIITEGKVRVRVPCAKIVSRELPVFYNPMMELNRSITLSLIRARACKKLFLADPLAGSGIRALRMLKELPAQYLKKLFVNDANHLFFKLWKQSCALNSISKGSQKKVVLGNTDASLFMLQQSGFDYVDIDPFGSPNPFLDAACKRLARGGMLAVTATDTAPLAGTYPTACRRKYDAVPLLDECKHETGIRILLRKIQLVASQYEKALVPVCCYANEHYYRVYLQCEKSKSLVDEVLRKHGVWRGAGPVWCGQLWDASLVKKMAGIAQTRAEQNLLQKLCEEAIIDAIGFIDVHAECKRLHRSVPQFSVIMEKVKLAKHDICVTHFAPTGMRTTMPRKEFVAMLKKL